MKTATKSDKEFMAKIASLPCVACGDYPVQVHHITEGKRADLFFVQLKGDELMGKPIPPLNIKMSAKKLKECGFFDWLREKPMQCDYYILEQHGI